MCVGRRLTSWAIQFSSHWVHFMLTVPLKFPLPLISLLSQISLHHDMTFDLCTVQQALHSVLWCEGRVARLREQVQPQVRKIGCAFFFPPPLPSSLNPSTFSLLFLFPPFPNRLNALVGGDVPYFKAVCSSEDETLLFPASTVDEFCQQMALCMAEKHPSKRWHRPSNSHIWQSHDEKYYALNHLVIILWQSHIMYLLYVLHINHMTLTWHSHDNHMTLTWQSHDNIVMCNSMHVKVQPICTSYSTFLM